MLTGDGFGCQVPSSASCLQIRRSRLRRIVWQSHLKHIDTKVIDCMEEHQRTAQTDGSKSMTVANICKATGLSEKQVTKSLDRLQREHKVRRHGENWVLV